MNKKIFSLLFIFLLVATFGFIGVNKINAATETIKVTDASTTFSFYYASGNKGDGTYRTVTGGQPGYCLQLGITGPGKGDKLTMKHPYDSGPVMYILNQGKSRRITQQAIWIYLHGKNSKLYPKTLSSKTTDYKESKALADAAKKNPKYTIKPAISSSVKNNKTITASKSSDGSNYISQTITVSTTNITGNSYTIDFSKAPSGTAAYTKASGGKKIPENTNTTAKSFVVKVPIKDVKKDVTFNVKLKANKTTYKTWKSYYIKNKQDLGVPVVHTASPSVGFSVKVKKQTCHKVGSTYYGINGTKVKDLTSWAKECSSTCEKTNKADALGYFWTPGYKAHYKSKTDINLVKACSSCTKAFDGKYYAKDGVRYATSTALTNANYLKACYNCHPTPVNGKYIGPNGERFDTKEEQNAFCKGTCTVKDGKYYDNTGKEVKTKKEMNKACYNCNTPKTNGVLYDNEGNEYTDEAKHQQVCNPHCQQVEDKYYDNNGKPVSKDEYLDQCFPKTPIPDPSKEVDTEIIRYEENYHYTIKHQVPFRSSVSYFKSYVFTDVLEEPLQIKSEKDVKIVQYDSTTNKETDWTDKFSISIEGQKITASLKNTNDANFYGTRNGEEETPKEYRYILTVSLKDNADTKFDMTKYKEDDYYVIPDVANISIIDANGESESQDTNKVDVKYYLEPTPVKMVSDFDQTKSYESGQKYTYTVSQQVLNYKDNQKYESFEFSDEFEKPIEMKSEKDLTIKNEIGENVTNWFDIKLNGQKVTATLKKEYNTEAFYGHIYDFIMEVNLKQGYNLKGYIKDNKYIIPNYAKVKIDGKEKKTNVVDVTVKLVAKPKIVTPNTASPIQIAAIAAGVAIIISGVYALLEKYNLIKPKKLNN